MPEKKVDSAPSTEAAQFKRRFRQAIICFAIVEFIVMAFAIYHKLAR
ncbi:MAG TPA: hypothetical protein VJS44_23285 [Pyrinomonadaceae bacterium]|nr:hypothetical protein [Pyrinomonadaceae bacterium]